MGLTSGGLVRGTLAMDVIVEWDDHLERMTGALWSWISTESKKMRGRELVYIGRMARKTKGCFDLNKQLSCKRHVFFTINDLKSTCQGYEHSLKGWVGPSSHDSLKDQIKPSPYRSFQLMIMDPWSEGAIEEEKNLR